MDQSEVFFLQFFVRLYKLNALTWCDAIFKIKQLFE